MVIIKEPEGIRIPGALVSDNFEDGNDTSNPVWTKSGGTWSVITDTSRPTGEQYVYKQSSSTVTALAFTGSSYSNYSVEAKIKMVTLGTAPNAGLMARYVDSNNYYALNMNPVTGAVSISKKVNGTVTTLNTASMTFSTGTWYTFKIVVNGTTITGYVNGVQKVSATDSSFTSGKAGIRQYQVSANVDDFIVTQ